MNRDTAVAGQEIEICVTWREASSCSDGLAGGIRLFFIGWSTASGKLNWSLRTDLPGLTGKVWESDDREKLYHTAEKVLAGWLARVCQTAEGRPELQVMRGTAAARPPGKGRRAAEGKHHQGHQPQRMQHRY